MKSPFEFGSTVSEQSFTNRVSERKRLYGNLTSGVSTILISPRRWGKSSLVEQSAIDILKKNKDIKIAFIDLFSVNTEEEFLELYARSIIKASTPKANEWLDLAKNSFKKLLPKLVLNTDLGDISIEFDKTEIKKHKDEILNLAETISIKKNCRFIVCVDEFQNIVNYDKEQKLEKSMRSYWQRHKNVAYCLYGSKRHMISDIFNDSSRAFYKFGDIIFLSKIETKDWVKFIVEKFEETKKFISQEGAEKIAFLSDNHSWYVQQLAHLTWLLTEKKVSPDLIENAFQQVVNSQLPLFENTIESVSNTQLNLLKAIYKKETQLTSVKTMEDYKLGTPNNVRKNIQILIQEDTIDKHGDSYYLIDPVFKHLFGKMVM